MKHVIPRGRTIRPRTIRPRINNGLNEFRFLKIPAKKRIIKNNSFSEYNAKENTERMLKQQGNDI